MNALLWACALALLGHSSSEGRSRFTLDSEGNVRIAIELGDHDIPELCALATNELDGDAALARCLSRDLPLRLRLRADAHACAVRFVDVKRQHGVVRIAADAACDRLPEKLSIDWGLFSGSGLDHVSVAQIEQPHAPPQLVLLSKRSSHVVVDVLRFGGPPVWMIAAALLGACVAAVAIRRRGTRQRRAPEHGEF